MNDSHKLKFKTAREWVHENAEYVYGWMQEAKYDRRGFMTTELEQVLIEFAKEENVFLIDQNTADWQIEIESYLPTEY
jgi:hypothetical protein